MSRKHKKDARQREWAAYEKMIRRIGKGEVSRLLWKPAGKSIPVIVLAGAIYVVEKTLQQPEHRRHVAPGDLARNFAELPNDTHWATD